MKTTKILVVIALMMGGIVSTEAQPVEPKMEFCAMASFGLADYTYVEDVEICKQVGVINSNGQATLACKKAPLYQKNGQYFVQTPESTSKTKLQPVSKNGWYKNPSFSDHWTYSYQYVAGNWYFNL